MSGLFGRLVQRAAEPGTHAVTPVLPSLFEPRTPAGAADAVGSPEGFGADAGHEDELRRRVRHEEAAPPELASAETAPRISRADAYGASAAEAHGPIAPPPALEPAPSRASAPRVLVQRAAQSASTPATISSSAVASAGTASAPIGQSPAGAPPAVSARVATRDATASPLDRAELAGLGRRSADEDDTLLPLVARPPAATSPPAAAPLSGRPPPADSLRRDDVTPAPVVRVHIGRIELRAVTPAAPPRAPAAPRANPMSLDEYMRRRDGGGAAR